VVTVWFWPSRAWRDAARMDEGRMVAADAAASPAVAAAASAAAVAAPTAASAASAASEVATLTVARPASEVATPNVSSPASATPATAVLSPVAPAGDKPPALAATEAAASGRLQINVGLFAEQANAQRAFTRLREAGLPATMQELTRNGRTLTRVRVGPFAARDVADTAAQKIRGLQLDAVVIRQ